MELDRKLEILANAAKYDASCASCGVKRPKASPQGLGTTQSSGICHSWSEDGRCISLLKLLFSNSCLYDCAYCLNRRSNDIPRASFTVKEVVDLTINFYKRNYIEGLFLSSGVIKSPDHTMERLCEIVRQLREDHGFSGYIHLKVVPGASQELIDKAGLLADRVSVNIELPSRESLKLLAPQKDREGILKPMKYLGRTISERKEERKKTKKAPVFAPAGQSTQLIVGASPETDYHILNLTEKLYDSVQLKRVYYSAYVPVNQHSSLPALTQPPMLREHRLYQADWLLRFYQFKAGEIIDPVMPYLDEEVDPKVSWALGHLEFFPVEVNRADYWQLLRVPGIGVRSVRRILRARRWSSLDIIDLQKMGVVIKRAHFFITCNGRYSAPNRSFTQDSLRLALTASEKRYNPKQLLLF